MHAHVRVHAEGWRSSYSIQYVLSAIQSLIMTTSPYYNEPGFETPPSDSAGKHEVEAYSSKIAHEVLRHAVCDNLEAALDNPALRMHTHRLHAYMCIADGQRLGT